STTRSWPTASKCPSSSSRGCSPTRSIASADRRRHRSASAVPTSRACSSRRRGDRYSVGAYILRRLLALIPLLLLITFFVFALSLLIPGDPARTIAGGLKADPQRVRAVRHQLHFDEPVLSQYWRWLTHALRGDLGRPLQDLRQSVAEGIKSHFPAT